MTWWNGAEGSKLDCVRINQRCCLRLRGRACAGGFGGMEGAMVDWVAVTGRSGFEVVSYVLQRLQASV